MKKHVQKLALGLFLATGSRDDNAHDLNSAKT